MSLRNTTLAAIAALAIAAAAGCSNNNEPVAGTDNATTDASAYVPTLAQVQAAVTMDSDDAAVVSSALADWRRAADTAGDERPFAGRRAGMAFLADVAPSLDNAQLADMVAFLSDFRDAHRRQARGEMRGGRGGFGRMEKQMAQDLGLSADQQKQMQQLHAEMRTQMRAHHEEMRDSDATPEERQADMKAFHDAQREKLAKILTPEQLEKHDALRTERRAERRERAMDRMEDHVSERTAWLAAVLGLSDEQKASVSDLLTKSMETRKAAMQQAIDENAPGPRMAWKQHAEQRDQTHQAIEALLTPQQKERFEIVNQLHDRGPRKQQP